MPALAEPAGESAVMPQAAAATVTLYTVRILKPLFRQIALPYATSCEFRAGVISEFLRAEKKEPTLSD